MKQLKWISYSRHFFFFFTMIPYNLHNYIMTGTHRVMFLCPVGYQTQWGSVTEPHRACLYQHQCGTLLLLGETYLVSVVCGGVGGILKWQRLRTGGLGSTSKEKKRKSREWMAETCGGGAARAGTARAGATALPREQRLYVLERLRGERKSRRALWRLFGHHEYSAGQHEYSIRQRFADSFWESWSWQKGLTSFQNLPVSREHMPPWRCGWDRRWRQRPRSFNEEKSEWQSPGPHCKDLRSIQAHSRAVSLLISIYVQLYSL